MAVMTETTPAIDGDAAPLNLPEEEVRRRVAVLKRFRELLQEQRDRFRAYLDVLDRQKDIIERGTPEELSSHVELEEKIVSDILSIQKVIDPLDGLYRSVYKAPPGARRGGEEAGVTGLKAALEGLKTEALARSGRNRELLSKRMAALRSEIKSLRANPYLKAARPGYPGAETASLVNLQG
jgi:hypothetical protein